MEPETTQHNVQDRVKTRSRNQNITVYVRGYTETDTTVMLSPPSVWREQSGCASSRGSGLIPAAMRIGFDCRCNGLNISNRFSDVTPLWDQRDQITVTDLKPKLWEEIGEKLNVIG